MLWHGRGAMRPWFNTAGPCLSLQRATQEAQTRYLVTVDKRVESPKARAEIVLGEIQAVLAWYFDDGVQDEKDDMLARLDAAHADDPATNDALASALDDYAHLADRYRQELDGLGGFEAALIDEAGELAAALRERPAQPEVSSSKTRDALALRNKLAGYLLAQMGLVRAAARFVFRNQPEIVREATSAYERRKRATTRRSKEAPAPAPKAAPAPAPSAPEGAPAPGSSATPTG